MKQPLNTVPKWGLPSLLKRSEKHALEWRIERGTSNQYYQRQVEKGFLSMTVSSKMIKRAMKILERFLLMSYDAGFSVTVEHNMFRAPASALVYDGEIVSFRLKEKQVSQPNRKDSYPSRILVPTGKLELELYAGYYEWKPSKLYADTDYTKLEDKIEDIVPYLKKAFDELKRIHEREEERRIEREEQARKKKEHEQALEERARQVKSIMRDIRLYDRARIIREYCDKVEPHVFSASYLKKIELARRFADWIDVTVDYTDELSEKYSEMDIWG